MTGASKLLIAAAAVLAITAPVRSRRGTIMGAEEAGGGAVAGTARGGWHEAGGWRGGGGWHDNGRHLGWYKHGWGGSGWRGTFASAQFGHGWGGREFVGAGRGWWDWRRAWGWGDFGWGWGAGGWAWGGLLAGASFGVIVAPPLIVAPPPIYAAPPPIIVGLPAIAAAADRGRPAAARGCSPP